MTIIRTKLTWEEVIGTEKSKPYFAAILNYIQAQKSQGKIIYPSYENIFNAFKLTPFANVKVVILGQDPYHGENQAHGICFSVKSGVRLPPSLQNIYKEIQTDTGIKMPKHGDLSAWAEQGVLLLNTVLTVEANKANSHSNIGWETFTDAVINAINEHNNNVVFLLWGNHAKQKCRNIDPSKHKVFTAPHPSPLSAHRGFLGCRHFSQANETLKQWERQTIDWSIQS